MSNHAKLAAFVVLLACASAAQSTWASPPDSRAILGEVRRVVSDHGIDEAKAIEIGGIRQWVTIRGRDRRNPILLVIHGGPAAPEMPTRYLYEAAWEDYFTVVQWDQRGSGKTYAMNDPAMVKPTMNRERIVQDAEELVAWLRTAYAKKKIFVMGHSWGTSVGLELAVRKPEWLYAYVGAGQMINFAAGERAGYAWTLAQARAAGDARGIAELTALAPYPGPDGKVPLDSLSVERKWSVHFGGLTHGRSSYDYWENAERISPDYSDADFKAIDQGSAFSLPLLLPDLMATDYTGVRSLKCPVEIFAGRYDYTTPTAPVRAWFDRLKAPAKRWVWFENSAHMMWAEEPGRVLVHLVQDLRPLAARAGDVAPD